MKQKPFASFIFELLALTIVLYGLLYITFNKLMDMPGLQFGLMLLVLFVVTAISHFIVIYSSKKDPRIFTYAYIGTSSARLILYSIFLLVYCYTHKENAKVFVLTFFALYIIYSVFEIKAVLGFLKKNQ